MEIQLSCVGMKAETWKRVMSLSDCESESQSMEKYCEGHFYSGEHRIFSANIRKPVKNQ